MPLRHGDQHRGFTPAQRKYVALAYMSQAQGAVADAAAGRRPLPWTPRRPVPERALPGDGEHLRGVVGSVPGDQTERFAVELPDQILAITR